MLVPGPLRYVAGSFAGIAAFTAVITLPVADVTMTSITPLTSTTSVTATTAHGLGRARGLLVLVPAVSLAVAGAC